MLALALLSAFVARHVNGNELTTRAWEGQYSTDTIQRQLFSSRRRRSTTTEPDPGRRRRSTTTERGGSVTVPPSHQLPGILIGTGVGIAGAVAAGTGIALSMAHDHDKITGATTTALPTLSQTFPQTTLSQTFPQTTLFQTFPQTTVSQIFPQTTLPPQRTTISPREGSSSLAAGIAIAALLCLLCVGLLGFFLCYNAKKKTSRPRVRPQAARPPPEPVVQEQTPLMAQGHWEQPMGHWEQEKQIVKVTTPSHVPEIVSWAPAATTMVPSSPATSLYTPAQYAPLATTQNYMPLGLTAPAPLASVFAAPTMVT